MSTSLNNLLMILVLASTCLNQGIVRAQLLKDLPDNALGVDVEDRVGEFIPLGLMFEDERGNKVSLAKYFRQGRPVVLTLNYSDCPGLCVAQLDNLVNTLREINGGGIGEKFDIVTVSIDPNESNEKAGRTKSKYVGLLRDSQAEAGWHFLTGKNKDIRALADSVGFRYHWDKINKRYNHPAATYFLSSEGRICRYLLSLGVEPEQFNLAVGEAREGKLTASLADAIIQLCYYYDPDANRYSADARRIMAFGGFAFTMLLTGLTAPFWFSRRTAATSATAKPAEPEQPSAADGHAISIGGSDSSDAPYN
ncbi:SCO family protein [Aureliella helgolandensis]|uniref:SCO family protein n=1 Tax=Aureliella helgolandensis TaxID=2527968 RepID=A0A518G123_9BACT|nr:SCO family protein [Aureliella helgolandensis]QDV22302.1 hypothetical protein Q31a_05860 [Aureliella helgolandensis]